MDLYNIGEFRKLVKSANFKIYEYVKTSSSGYIFRQKSYPPLVDVFHNVEASGTISAHHGECEILESNGGTEISQILGKE